MPNAVGLDFGTSTTLMALADGHGVTRVLPLGQPAGFTDPWLPSVAQRNGHGLVVGEAPNNLPAGVFRSAKRAITRLRKETSASGGVEPPADADDVIGAILAEAAARAELLMPGLLSSSPVRLGCPAMWDRSQRERLAAIARAKGLDVSLLEMIDEPVAAGVGWVTEQRDSGTHVQGRVLVVDIGGGTLDIALLDIVDDGDTPRFDVLSADAVDTAGDDIDAALAGQLVESLQERGFDPDNAPDPALAHALILQAAQSLKVRLSASRESTVDVPAGIGVPFLTLNHLAVEQAVRPLIQQANDLAKNVLASARLRERNAPSPEMIRRNLGCVMKDPAHLLLTGGGSFIPAVRNAFAAMFPESHVHYTQNHSPQHTVAMGLAASDHYTHLNLHRPPFDLVVVYPDGTRETLYAAHTPLYEKWEVASGRNQLGYPMTIRGRGSLSADVKVYCQTLDGGWAPIVVSGHGGDIRSDALTLRIPPHSDGSAKLYVDGRITLSAPGAGTQIYRMTRWPVLRSDERGVPSPIRLIREPHMGDGEYELGSPGYA